MKIENLRYANALEQKLAILEKRCTGFVEKIEF